MTDPKELYAKLRKGCSCGKCRHDACCCGIMDEAADLIESLETRLTESLETRLTETQAALEAERAKGRGCGRRCLICANLNPCPRHSDQEQTDELARNDAEIARIRSGVTVANPTRRPVRH